MRGPGSETLHKCGLMHRIETATQTDHFVGAHNTLAGKSSAIFPSSTSWPRLQSLLRDGAEGRLSARVPDKPRQLLANLRAIDVAIARRDDIDDEITIGDGNIAATL